MKRLKSIGARLRLLRVHPYDSATEAGRALERERRLALSLLTSVAARIVSVVTMLISVPIAHAYLSLEGFGVWMTLASLILIVQFADLGIGNGLVTVISHLSGRDEHEKIAAAVSSASVILVSVCLILCGLAVGVILNVDWERAFKVSTLGSKSLYGAMIVFCVCLALTVPATLGQKIQWSFQEAYRANVWQMLGSALMVLMMLLASRLSLGLWGMVLGTTGGPLLAFAGSTLEQVIFRRPWLRPRMALASREVALPILAIGGAWGLYQGLLFAATGMDGLFVTRMFGAASMGTYGIMMRIMAGLAVAILLTVPLWPTFAEALSREDYSWAKRTAGRALVGCAAIGVCTGAIILFLSQWMVRIWIGQSVVPERGLVVAFAAWVFVYNVFAGVSSLMVNPLLMRKMMFITTSGSLVALGLKVPLGDRLGAAGICWASVVGIGGATVAGIIAIRATLHERQFKQSSIERAD